MSTKEPPNKRLTLRPGEDPYAAMARELAENPDSPASLQIMSAMSNALAPRQRAIDQVIEAIQAQLQRPGPLQDSAVMAAVRHWERECGETMSNDVLADLTNEARQRIRSLRRQPPSMQSILGSRPDTTDTGYRLGVHMEGLDGTWHRLWGMIALVHSFGSDVAEDDGVAAVREQFHQVLGRHMTVAEWDALVAHAAHHAETEMSDLPRLDDAA